ncbi:P-loop containing nucleoside triphosphate hydrolase protein [Schizophyllum amplum]|uniref:P-loop containing nucleoside triphosphate hydrolase protein n=1 Tax=Schizophyllum amplum TaxID=97359 RepID=A0A550CYL4_9AGAR|nr:P-loop containing nucleoside triphosphate hydrolase protein [Auriculariopsis ampla]
MADNAVQRVLAILAQPGISPGTYIDDAANATVTSSASIPSATQTTQLVDLPAILAPVLSLFFWFSALPDWIKLLVIGGVVETCRRMLFVLYRHAANAFVITATFNDNDDCFNWMMFWLSRQPSWTAARELEISTHSFGVRGDFTTVPGEEADASALLNENRPLIFMPTAGRTHALWFPADAPWYAQCRVAVTRMQRDTKSYHGLAESLEVRIFTRSHAMLNRLLLEAKRAHAAEQQNKISIYAAQSKDVWRHTASRAKRSLTSIVLDPGIKDTLLNDARDFIESRDWYSDRGIPFRRGYLLYGPPGCGKTSMIHSMAGELGLDVYIISLSRAGMDDTSLSALIGDLPEKCIALMEDIDVAFTKNTGARLEDAADEAEDKIKDEIKDETKPRGGPDPNSLITSRVSLSGLLNALDGVGAQEGRILFATTNHYEALDPALCRPGRMDVHVEFRLASKYQARELFSHFYAPRHLSDDAKVEGPHDQGRELSASGSSAASESSCTSTTSDDSSETVCLGTPQRARLFRLDPAVAGALAARFAEAVPEREISMASLQGYLMGYKVRPQDAVEDVERWVAVQRAEKKTRNARKATIFQAV